MLRWKIAQWFELRWWRSYLKGKDKNAYLAWKRNYWLTLLSKIENEVSAGPEKQIADLGCGPAGIFIALPGNSITAVDPLLNEYEQQITFFKQADYPHINFIAATIEDFKPVQKFDLVFCMNAINHVKNIETAFERLRQATANAGCLVVSIDAHNHAFFKHLFRLIPGDILHPHQYDLTEYSRLLGSNGWQITATAILKKEFFFNHYVLVAKKQAAVI